MISPFTRLISHYWRQDQIRPTELSASYFQLLENYNQLAGLLKQFQSWRGDESSGESVFGIVQIIPSAYHLEKPISSASLIHACLQHSTALEIVSQLLFLWLFSGQESSSSLTCKAYMTALHKPSGLQSSWSVLLLKE